MPTIDTAEDAVQIAERFIAKYHAFRILKKVVRQQENWVVEFDVGAIGTKIVRLTVDVQTGKVVDYNEV